VIGASLTLAPVVYVMLERLIFLKVAAVGVVILLAIVFAIDAPTWRALPGGLVGVGNVPWQLGFALLLGAVAFAGAGGGQNLCQSNWIRDKGFGMGQYVPRLVSPLTGEEKADFTNVEAFIFEPTPANMARWRRWWRFANIEQFVTFVLVTVVTICLTSMLAYATLYGREGLPQTVAFLQIEGRRLQEIVGPWFGVLFWAIGSFSLFASAMGITDYTSRLAADVIKTTYLRESPVSESRLYFWLVWGLVALGCSILIIGMNQPLVLLVISASVGGTMMCMYSAMLLVLNRTWLPAAIRIGGYRAAVLIWSTLFFGILAGLTIQQQLQRLLG
jgi:hypothetical protein